MKTVVVNSYAKVNIGLKILNPRGDGYHDIATVFQEVDLFDTITISKKGKNCNFNSNVNWLKNS